jgi:hypothetical protein
MVNSFPPVKPTQVEVQLYDALEWLVMELYADVPSRKGEKRAQRALARFEKAYGGRHDGKWRAENTSVPAEQIKEAVTKVVNQRKANNEPEA